MESTKSSCVWLIDSGATQHMTHSNEFMKTYKEISPVDVHLADYGVVQAIGTGDIVMSMKTPRDSLSFQHEKPRSYARSH